ncbi:MAG: hypothetical protein ACOWWH_12790 [Eubacteriaceae bacterium]
MELIMLLFIILVGLISLSLGIKILKFILGLCMLIVFVICIISGIIPLAILACIVLIIFVLIKGIFA